MARCSFCDEIRGLETDYNFYRRYIESEVVYKDRVIFGNLNWVVMPSLGALVPGYLVVVTKKHFLSLGDVPIEYLKDLEWLIPCFCQLNKQLFGKNAIIFEHGSFESGGASACVEHTHLHFVPSKISLLPFLSEDFEIIPIGSRFEIKKIASTCKGYLYYKDIDGKEFFVYGQEIPSQYMRQLFVVAQGLELSGWNWRSDLNIPNVISTLKVYKSLLRCDLG